jgi:hypothetical protein
MCAKRFCSFVRRCTLQPACSSTTTSAGYTRPALDGTYRDYDDWLEELAPHEPVSKYRHNRTGESLSWTIVQE